MTFPPHTPLGIPEEDLELELLRRHQLVLIRSIQGKHVTERTSSQLPVQLRCAVRKLMMLGLPEEDASLGAGRAQQREACSAPPGLSPLLNGNGMSLDAGGASNLSLLPGSLLSSRRF